MGVGVGRDGWPAPTSEQSCADYRNFTNKKKTLKKVSINIQIQIKVGKKRKKFRKSEKDL